MSFKILIIYLASKGGLVSVEMNEPSYWLDLKGNNDLNDC